MPSCAAVTLWPQPMMWRSLLAELGELPLPMMTFSTVLPYIVITSLSAAAFTAAWSVV